MSIPERKIITFEHLICVLSFTEILILLFYFQIPNNQIRNVPVAIIASDRPRYLYRYILIRTRLFPHFPRITDHIVFTLIISLMSFDQISTIVYVVKCVGFSLLIIVHVTSLLV